MSQKIKELIALGKRQRFITLDDFNKALPSREVSSAKIKQVVIRLIELRIDLVESGNGEEIIDCERACVRSAQRLDWAIAAFRRKRVSQTIQLLKTSLDELQSHASEEQWP